MYNAHEPFLESIGFIKDDKAKKKEVWILSTNEHEFRIYIKFALGLYGAKKPSNNRCLSITMAHKNGMRARRRDLHIYNGRYVFLDMDFTHKLFESIGILANVTA